MRIGLDPVVPAKAAQVADLRRAGDLQGAEAGQRAGSDRVAVQPQPQFLRNHLVGAGEVGVNRLPGWGVGDPRVLAAFLANYRARLWNPVTGAETTK